MAEQLRYFVVKGKLTNAFLVVQNKTSRVVYLSLGRDEELQYRQARVDFDKLSAKTKVEYELNEREQDNKDLEAVAENVRKLMDDSAPIMVDYEYIFGTEFQKRVWSELEKVPSGQTVTYTTIAKNLGSPNATRAVGNAIGQNKLALIVPCHRCLPASGSTGGFRWGPVLKRKLVRQERFFKTR